MATPVLPSDVSPKVQELLAAGKLKWNASEVTVGAKSSPTGREIKIPFQELVPADYADTETTLVVADGKMDDINRAYYNELNNYRRLLTRNRGIESEKNTPEFQFMIRAKALQDSEAAGVKPAKRYRGLSFEALVDVLKNEAEEE